MAMKVSKKEAFTFLGYLGAALLISGYFRYSVREIWTIWEQAMLGVGGALLVLSVVMNFAAIRAFFGRRSTRLGTNTLVITTAVAAILVMINFLGYRHSKRFDLTEEQLYTLSDQTRRILSDLDRDVKIMFFDTTNDTLLRTRMEQYKSYSRRISYEWVDPDQEPEVARQYGATPSRQILAVSGSHIEEVEGREEQDITNAILKVTRDETKKICFVEGHGEKSLSNSQGGGYSTVEAVLKNENYEVDTINLAASNGAPPDCTVLVVAGPQRPLFPEEISTISTFLDRGGKALLLLDPATEPGLEEVLMKWGVEVGNDFVIEESASGRAAGTERAVPLVTEYGAHPIAQPFTRGFLVITTFYPLARSVKRAEDVPTDIEVIELLKTSPTSRAVAQLDLAALAEGDGSAPDESQGEQGPISLGVVASKKVDQKEARVVVIGDSDFANNQFVRYNGDLFLNAVNWLAEDENLISVRPKSPTNRRVTMRASEQSLLFWFSLLLLPGTVILSGIYVWWRRR